MRPTDDREMSVAGRESVAQAPSSRSTRVSDRPIRSEIASAHGPSTACPRTCRPYTSTTSGRDRTGTVSSIASPEGTVIERMREPRSQLAVVRTSEVSRFPL